MNDNIFKCNECGNEFNEILIKGYICPLSCCNGTLIRITNELCWDEYRKKVIMFGKTIGCDFEFIINSKTYNVELIAPTVNNLNPLVKVFTQEYVIKNKCWKEELKWLKKRFVRKNRK